MWLPLLFLALLACTACGRSLSDVVREYGKPDHVADTSQVVTPPNLRGWKDPERRFVFDYNAARKRFYVNERLEVTAVGELEQLNDVGQDVTHRPDVREHDITAMLRVVGRPELLSGNEVSCIDSEAACIIWWLHRGMYINRDGYVVLFRDSDKNTVPVPTGD